MSATIFPLTNTLPFVLLSSLAGCMPPNTSVCCCVPVWSSLAVGEWSCWSLSCMITVRLFPWRPWTSWMRPVKTRWKHTLQSHLSFLWFCATIISRLSKNVPDSYFYCYYWKNNSWKGNLSNFLHTLSGGWSVFQFHEGRGAGTLALDPNNPNNHHIVIKPSYCLFLFGIGQPSCTDPA